ncbi:MAG: glutathione S-transferase C-terminal domain-containing protein [Pseudomonadota bacterium]
MGMLINGIWQDDEDRSMVGGTYRREVSALQTDLGEETLALMKNIKTRFYLIASASCPWSHGAVLALTLSGLGDHIPIQWAGGPRVQGYGLLPGGPIPNQASMQHVHQFYTKTIPNYTGRSTVPILWDSEDKQILSNASADIMLAFNTLSDGPDLNPDALTQEIALMTQHIFDGLSNAVYRAGKSQRQDEYDAAVNTVFATIDGLEARLEGQNFLFGATPTLADLRLFATLVRFDTVYATHFRCIRKRVVDYPNLWRFTRRIYHLPGVKETVDFDEIRFGYYINDGAHNPFGIIGQQPEIDWDNTADL